MNEPHCYGKMDWILKYPKEKIPEFSICNCHFSKECKEITLAKIKGAKRVSRYIDADITLEDIRNLAEKHHMNGEYEFANGVLKAITRIKSQPTADVKEVIYGEWNVEKKNVRLENGMSAQWISVYCTNCGKENNYKTDFCPNCGADMRGAKANAKPISETKRLLNLVNLAIEHLQGDCTCCQNHETCKDKRGSHKYCWKWLYQQEYDEVRRKYVKY